MLTGRVIRLVLTIPVYAVVALAATILSITVFVTVQNWEAFLFGFSLPLSNVPSYFVGFYPFLGSYFPLHVDVLLLVVGILTGVDIALLTYQLRHVGLALREGSSGGIGVILGILGAGCAACGTALLAGVFALFGAASLLTLLPLEGAEFLILAAIALLISLAWMAKGLQGSTIGGCPV